MGLDSSDIILRLETATFQLPYYLALQQDYLKI